MYSRQHTLLPHRGPIYKRTQRLPEPRAGQSFVEFALALPVVLIIIIGTLNLGLAIRAQLQLAQVAQQAAQYLVHHPDYADPDPVTGNYTKLLTYINSLSSYQLTPLEINLTAGTSLIQVTGGYTATVQQDTVTINYPFRLIMPLAGKLAVGSLNNGTLGLGAKASTVAASHPVSGVSVCGPSPSTACSPTLSPSYAHKITWTPPVEATSIGLPLWYCIDRTYQDANSTPAFHDDIIFNAPSFPAVNGLGCITGTASGSQLYFIDPTNYTSANINQQQGLFYTITTIQRNGLQSPPVEAGAQ